MLTLIKKHYQKLIFSVVTFIVGILCIIVGAASGEASAEAYQNIGRVIGVSLIIVGSIAVVAALVLTIFTRRNAIGLAGGSASILAAGIYLAVNQTVCGSLIYLFILYVPYLLLVIGCLSLCEVIVTALLSIKQESLKNILVTLILGSIGGVIAVVIGALAVGDDPVISHNVQMIIFGVILIIVAIVLILNTLFFGNVISSIFTSDEDYYDTPRHHKDAIDAEVRDR